MVHSSTDGQINHRLISPTTTATTTTTFTLFPGTTAFGPLLHNNKTSVKTTKQYIANNRQHRKYTSSSSTPVLSASSVDKTSTRIFRWILSRKNKTISSTQDKQMGFKTSHSLCYSTWTQNDNHSRESCLGSPLRESYSFDDIDSLIQMTPEERMSRKMPSFQDNNNKMMPFARRTKRTSSSSKRKSMTISCSDQMEGESEQKQQQEESQDVLESSFKQKMTSKSTSKLGNKKKTSFFDQQQLPDTFVQEDNQVEDHDHRKMSRLEDSEQDSTLKRRLSSSSLYSFLTSSSCSQDSRRKQELLTVKNGFDVTDDEDKRHLYLRENHISEYDYGSVKSVKTVSTQGPSDHHDKCCWDSLQEKEVSCKDGDDDLLQTRRKSIPNNINKTRKQQQQSSRIGVNDPEQTVLFEAEECNGSSQNSSQNISHNKSHHDRMSSLFAKSSSLHASSSCSLYSCLRSKSNLCLNTISNRAKLCQRRSLTFEPNSFLATRLEEEDEDNLIDTELSCLLCLESLPSKSFFKLSSCGCQFCFECLSQYVEYSIENNINVSSISCPDAKCPQSTKLPQSPSKKTLVKKSSSPIKKIMSWKNKKSSDSKNKEESMKISSNIVTNNAINEDEVSQLVSLKAQRLYRKRLVEESVNSDSNRVFCPTADCGNICVVPVVSTRSPVMTRSSSIYSSVSPSAASVVLMSQHQRKIEVLKTSDMMIAIHCDACDHTFCFKCRKEYHEGKDCQGRHDAGFSSKKLRKKSSSRNSISSLMNNNNIDNIKKCPKCSIYIEREEGCAQMMCRKCRHVFCWFCLKSLEDDYLLRHYDSGSCKNKLGHSRLSVLWHRTQVIGIFAGFGLLLIAVSPLFLLAAPCLLCCNSCSCLGNCVKNWIKIDENEEEGFKSRKTSTPSNMEDDDDLIIVEV